MYTYIDICSHAHTRTHTPTPAHIHAQIHTHAHKFIYICTHIDLSVLDAKRDLPYIKSGV